MAGWSQWCPIYVISGSCKPNMPLIDRHPNKETAIKKVLIRWRRPCQLADISPQQNRPQLNSTRKSASCNFWCGKFLKIHEEFLCLPATDVIRHVALIKCVKLPTVRASLSRHSNCYTGLKPLLGARLACHRLFPPPGVAKLHINYPN